MKRKILLCFVISVLLLMLCGCEHEYVEYSTGAMNYQLPDNYAPARHQFLANENYNKTLRGNVSDEDGITAEDYLELDWFDCGSNALSVTALSVPYNNDEFDELLKDLNVMDGLDIKKVSVNGATGCYGKESVEGEEFINSVIYLLKDGIYYEFTFFSMDNMDEEELSTIIASISFDSNNLKSRVVTCEDVTLKISGLYQDLNVEPDDYYLSKEAYGVYGDYRTDLELLCNEMEEGTTIEDYAEYLKEEFQNGSYSEVMESFGKCYYYSGKLENSTMAFAMFALDNKRYLIGLSNEADVEITISEIQDIIKTVQLTETNA